MTRLVQRASASSSMCVVNKQQPPAALMSPMESHMPRRLRGSRPVVGSSRMATAGEPTMAQATQRRRLMPPLSVLGIESCFSCNLVAPRIFRTPFVAARPESPRMRAKRRMFSLTVRSSFKTVSCGQRPMVVAPPAAPPPTAVGRMSTEPPVGASSPVMQRIVVVLPAPLGPKRPSVAPAAAKKVTLLSTRSWAPGKAPAVAGSHP
mmetsp:Transcript_24326/g.75675  ORF Transcript_24326/g.75675 Transcript_24326/m.75675 type:complete len:206 (-) Transcript_24326:34-651(-)